MFRYIKSDILNFITELLSLTIK